MTPPELHPGAPAGDAYSDDAFQAALRADRFSDAARIVAAHKEVLRERRPAVTPFDRFCYHAREYGLFLAELSLKGAAYAAVIVLALQINEHLDDIVAFLGQLP